MTKTETPETVRTVVIRADGTTIHGLAASATEGHRWVAAVHNHGRGAALPEIVLTATTPARKPLETTLATNTSDWEHVDTWVETGAQENDPRSGRPLPAGTRTVIIDRAGTVPQLTADPDNGPGRTPKAYLHYLETLPSQASQPLAVVHASAHPARLWIGIRLQSARVLHLPDD